MAYDSAISSFTTKTNKVDLVDAAHINTVQAELVTIETILGTLVKGDRANLKTRLNNMMDADGSVLSGTSYPSPALGSQLFYKTDVTTLYVHNITAGTWDALGGSLSNVVFCFGNGVVGAADVGHQIVPYTAYTPAAITATMPSWGNVLADGNYATVITTRLKKISGFNNLQMYVSGANRNNAAGMNVRFALNSGGTVSSDIAFSTSTLAWNNSNVLDISGLTNGTVYDLTIQIKSDGTAGSSYIYGGIIFGS